MTDSRTPPKFVPTLTEVAAQDSEPVFDDSLIPSPDATPAPTFDASIPASDSGAPETPMIEVFRLRREIDPPALEAVPSDAEIASLTTASGWAQSALVAQEDTVQVPDIDPERFRIDTEQSIPPPPEQAPVVLPAVAAVPTPVSDQPSEAADAVPVPAVVVPPVEGASIDAAMQVVTANLVASAAATAQELEDAITRRVLRRVQETLDERLTSAVLKVVEQQTALLQSSLQLEIDTSIRDAVAATVQQVLRVESAEQGQAIEKKTY